MDNFSCSHCYKYYMNTYYAHDGMCNTHTPLQT